MNDTSLDALAAHINWHFEFLAHAGPHYDNHRVSVGHLLIAARESVEHGNWHHWLKANIKRSIRDCQKAMALTLARDPRKELADQRERNWRESGATDSASESLRYQRLTNVRMSGAVRPCHGGVWRC